ncbi:zinc protease [Pedobacter sp. UYEF25]
MKKIVMIVVAALGAQTLSAQIIDRTHPPAAGPAPTITIGDPTVYKLPNGITVLVVENHKLPKITATYSIDAGPIKEADKAGINGLMGGMLNEGTISKTKVQFDEAVDKVGAEVSLNSGGGFASALTRYFPTAFMLMADGLRNPIFSEESFKKLKSQTLTGLKSSERSASAISARVVNALSYGKDNPYGEFETEKSINNISLADVKAEYKKYVTPSRGYLTFVGDIKPSDAKALAEKAFGDWKGEALKFPILKPVANLSKTEVDVIDLSNAVQAEITVTNLINLPLSSPDYFAVLLANNILGGGAEARLFKNLREKHGFTYGAYSNTGAGRFQTKFTASAAVRNEKVDSAVVEFLKEINNIRTEKVSTEELQNSKNLYSGSFALGLENPALTAAFASNILLNDLPKDFYRTYLQKMNAVTADDVMRVAKKYFNHTDTRVVIVGKAETFVEGLNKNGFSVSMFDNYANPVTAASNSTAPALAPMQIIGNYIKALGGEAAIKKITSVVQKGEMALQGQKLAIDIKSMAPNLTSVEVTMGGQTAMKEAFNGNTGYTLQMGQKSEMSGEDLIAKKEEKGIVKQLYYSTDGTKLEAAGTVKIGDADAYKLIVTSPSGLKKTEYYDVKTGLLLKDEKTSKKGSVEITQSTEYKDYRKVGDVLFPYNMMQSVQTPQGAQDFTITITDVKTNTVLKAEDFN